MADDNRKNKNGFPGLSDLVSKGSSTDDTVSAEPESEAKPSPRTQSSSSTGKEEPHSKHEHRSTASLSPIETVSDGKNDGDSGGKWFLGLLAVVFVIFLVSDKKQSTNTPADNPPSASLIGLDPIATQNSGLQYKKPSVGTDNVLSAPHILWCIREDIRIETMMDIIDTNDGIDALNRIINDYNIRCGSYRYRQGAQQRAERDIEAYRSQIELEAIHDARQLNRSHQSSPPSEVPGASTDGATVQHLITQYTQEVQQLLTDIGYDPGPIDGQYGPRTVGAVKAFQRDLGITQDGQITQDLVSALKKSALKNSDSSQH